jgi:hypothetical protein
MLINRLKPKPCISRFFDNNCGMWGAQVIGVLRAFPDKMIHSIELSHYVEPPEGCIECNPDQADYLVRYESAIPMTDDRTLRQIDAEIIRLVSIKAEKQNLGLDVSDLEAELEMLQDYHRQCTRPNGKIRSFRTGSFQAYQRHMSGIRRLLIKAKAECPEAYYYVKAHLLTGINFCWSSQDLSANKVKSPQRHKSRKRTRGKAASRKSRNPRHF